MSIFIFKMAVILGVSTAAVRIKKHTPGTRPSTQWSLNKWLLFHPPLWTNVQLPWAIFTTPLQAPSIALSSVYHKECQSSFTVTDYTTPSLKVGDGSGSPLPHSCLENPMDGGAWWAVVQGVTKSRIQLSDFTFTFHFHALEKEMATHSSVLAWRIPGTEESGRLLSMGLQSWTPLKWLSSSSSSLKVSAWVPSSTRSQI